MKTFYGPFIRISAKDKWHWKEECPDYPDESKAESMITSISPDPFTMCEHCEKLGNPKYNGSLTNGFAQVDYNRSILTEQQLNRNIIIRNIITTEQQKKNYNDIKSLVQEDKIRNVQGKFNEKTQSNNNNSIS